MAPIFHTTSQAVDTVSIFPVISHIGNCLQLNPIHHAYRHGLQIGQDWACRRLVEKENIHGC